MKNSKSSAAENRKSEIGNQRSETRSCRALRGILLFSIFHFAFFIFCVSSHATTYDWLGATNGNMTGTPANWGGTVPTGTDVALWNAATYTTAPTANGNMPIGQLLFDAGNTGGVTFGAGTGTLTLNGVSGVGIQMNSGSGAVSTGSAKFAIGASQSWINNDDSLLTVNGTITNSGNLTAKTLTVDGSGNTALTNGVISDGGTVGTLAITKNGTGTLAIGSASSNTFTGGLTLNAGTVSFGNTGSLGSGNVTVAGGTFVNTGGNINTSTVTGWTLNSDLTFGVSAGNWNTGTGAVSLGAANIAINNNNTGTARTLTVGGTITGTSNLTLNTGGTSTTTLTSANNTGTITVLNASNTQSIVNITTMGSNVTSLTMGAPNSGSTTTVSNIVVNSAGTTLNNNMTAGTGRALSIGNTTGTGDLFINNNATVGNVMVSTTGTASALGSINHTGNLTYGGTGSATWGVVNMNIGPNVVNVSKSNSAQLNLNGVNTYTGNTTVSSGVLALTGSFSSSGNYIANTGGTLYEDFSSGLATGSGNQANKINPAATLQLDGGTLTVNAAPNKAAVTNKSWTSVTTAGLPAGQVQLNFAAAPAVTVGQPITATGISAGSYVVRISGNNVIVASSTTPAATGTDFAAAATTTTRTSQTFAGTTLNAGASTIKAATDSGAGSGTAINIGAITRNVGSTLQFINPTGTLTANNSIQTTSGTASTILTDSGVAYATIGTTDWAGKDSGNAWITAPTYTAATTTALSGNADMSVASQNTTLATGASITSLRFNQNSAHTITVTSGSLTTGGILVGSTVTTTVQTITGGNLMSASTAGKDLPVIVNSTTGGLTINSTIVDNTSATGLTKSGTGSLTLGGANTYSGNTRINAGNVTLTNNLALQNSAADTSGVGTITLSGTNTPTLGGLIGSKDLASVITSGASGVTSLTLNPGNAVTNSYSGVIANLGSGAMALNKTGAGKQVLSGNNTYTGATDVTGGTLLVNNTSGSATGSGAVSVASGATLGGNGTIAGTATLTGSLAPGDGGIGTLTTGALTWAGAATAGANTNWVFQLGTPGTSDRLTINGDFLKNTTAGSVFLFDFGASTGTGTWTLVNWTGTTGFTDANEFSFSSSSGLTGSFGFSDSSLQFTSGTPVPEPATWISMAALALGGTVLTLRRRRLMESMKYEG